MKANTSNRSDGSKARWKYWLRQTNNNTFHPRGSQSALQTHRGRNHFICHWNTVSSARLLSSAPRRSSRQRAETVWAFRKARSFSGNWTTLLESGSWFNCDSYDSKWHYVGWAAEHQAHTMYLKVPSCKKDGNQVRICWCSPASGSKGYRKQQQGRGLKFLNLPGDYKWISYRPQDWGIRISCPWFSCYLHMEFRVNRFSPPQLPPSRHSDIQPLLATVWKKAKHYCWASLLKAGLAYHQLCWNIDRSIIFIPLPFAPSLFPSTCCARGPCCHLTGDSHSPLLQRWSTETQSKLRPFTCYWNTNNQET